MVAPNETAQRILTAFLKLASERGFGATTTRAVAQEAGVNEVTIFRYFKDKTTLIREAYHHFGPGSRIVAYPLSIDASSPERALEGLVGCLRFLRDCFREHPQLLLAGMSEYWHFPELQDELAFHPHAAYSLIKKALAQAAPALRPDVDRETAAFSLLGLLQVMLSWQYRDWLALTDEQWDSKFAAAIHPWMCA